jgi:hypothetical protein
MAIEKNICSNNLLNGLIKAKLHSGSSFKSQEFIDKLLHSEYNSSSLNTKGTLSSTSFS